MKLFSMILVVGLLSGCAPAWDVLDIILSDPVAHEGTVYRVEKTTDTTTVHFEDGMSYTVSGDHYVKPGEKAKVTRTDEGYGVER